MSDNEEVTVTPYKIERACAPHPDIEQLVLKEVDTTESVYTRMLVQLKDASLPNSVLFDPTEQISLGVVSWGLFVTLKYRQDWRASGYGLGELLYAISLLPNEELTLEVKTWETSKTQQDVEDSTDVRNVSDIKTSSSNTNELTSGEESKSHEYVDAKAGYSGFGFSASVAAGWSQDVSNMQKNFAKQTQDRSQQATNEYRATRKVKMSVSRESGSESKTTRKIKNINQAHTLNVNYYEVLREYEVKLTLDEVSLLLLGAEADLSQNTKYVTSDDPPQVLSIGKMIRLSRSAEWVQAFTDKYGVSPIKVLREMWSAPLYDAALTTADWTNPNVQIQPEDREAFRDTVLQYVSPASGWVEPDQTGALRWAYQVLPGQEQALLEYIYQFLPHGVQQVIGRARLANVGTVAAYEGILTRYAEAIIPDFRVTRLPVLREKVLRTTSSATPLKLAKSNKILVSGPFYEQTVPEFHKTIPGWVRGIVDQLAKLQGATGVIKSAKRTLGQWYSPLRVSIQT